MVTAEHIVDGHREKTLALLWKIILHWQVDAALSTEALKAELDYLRKQRHRRAADQPVGVDDDDGGDEEVWVGLPVRAAGGLTAAARRP